MTVRSRLVDAASERLAASNTEEPPITEAEMMRLLAGIARRGRPGDRLRAIELLGKQMGLFSEKGEKPQSVAERQERTRKLREDLMRRINALCVPERAAVLTVIAEKGRSP
jgi:hypothetical protein